MQFQPLSLIALATYTIASPTSVPQFVDALPKTGEPFGVGAVGPSIQNLQLTASDGQIYIGGTQTPDCERGELQDFATFVIECDKSVHLYNKDSPFQQLWVDQSGMGQGISGYTSGNETAPRNAGRGDFEIDGKGLLTFNGVGAKACPTSKKGQWSVWFTTSETPGWSKGCVSVELKAYDAPARVACTYSSSSSSE